MSWTDLPLNRPVSTVMVLLCLCVLGAVAVAQMPLGFMPRVLEPEIDINVPYPGSHPIETLREIVEPIEEEVAAVPGVKAIFGTASQESGDLEVQFEWGVDVNIKRMEVRDAVDRARPRLPEGIGQIRVAGDEGGPSSEIIGGRISAERDLSESWELLDRRIRRPLERIRGVARVNLYGVDRQEVRIDIDLQALQRHGIDAGEVIATINRANLDLDLGSIRGDHLRYDLRSVARFRDVGTIRDLPLPGGALRLRDVAEVKLREPVLTRGRHLNRKFAIGFDVYKDAAANTIDTVRRIEARLDEIRQDPELIGIDVLVWQNQADEITGSLEGLRNAGLFGGMMAICVLFMFLGRLTTTAIVGVAIPFSLIVTCGGMYAIGMEFNVLSMLGLMLGVGMLVDNAVVVIENIYRLQAKGYSPKEASRLGVRQVGLAVTAATATTLIVWSWLFVTEPNEMRIYIGQVASVICIAVVCSWIVSLSFIPLCASRFAPGRGAREGRLLRRVVPLYRQLLAWTLHRRALSLTLLFLLAASAAIPIVQIEKSGEPREQQREVTIRYAVYDPSTREILERHVSTVEAVLEEQREALGFEFLYSWFSEPQEALTRVYLPARDASEEGIRRLRGQLRGLLPVIPGVKLEVGEDFRGRQRGPRQRNFVRLALHGEDPDFLQQLGLDVERRMRELEHAVEVWGPSLRGAEELRVVVDPERARQLDVTPERVAAAVSFAFRGQRLRRFQAPRGEIEILVGLDETLRPGLSALEDLSVPTQRGGSVRLGSVAAIELSRTPPRIQREERKTTVWVTVEFDADQVAPIAGRTAVERSMADFSPPDGYSWDWGGGRRRDDEALQIMLRGILISLLVVLLLMAALFESFTQPLAILITLPLALFGAFWTLWLFGYEFEILGFIGVIILIGVVVNNGIVMVDHVNALRRQGIERDAALIEGCGDRLRPVLMTVITTVVGLIPLAMSEFTVAQVYIQTLAVAMIGGLISSTVFTLIALPVWYTSIEDLGAVLAGLIPKTPPAASRAERRSVLDPSR